MTALFKMNSLDCKKKTYCLTDAEKQNLKKKLEKHKS